MISMKMTVRGINYTIPVQWFGELLERITDLYLYSLKNM